MRLTFFVPIVPEGKLRVATVLGVTVELRCFYCNDLAISIIQLLRKLWTHRRAEEPPISPLKSREINSMFAFNLRQAVRQSLRSAPDNKHSVSESLLVSCSFSIGHAAFGPGRPHIFTAAKCSTAGD